MEAQKIIYIDFDETTCSHTLQDNKTQVLFENETDEIAELKMLFGKSYILKQTISNLSKLKQAGVVLVGVTARDQKTGLNLDPTVLKLFNRIYTGSSFRCYDVANKCFLEDYDSKVTNVYRQEIDRNYKRLLFILNALNITPTIFPTTQMEPYIYIRFEDCDGKVESLIQYCNTNSLETLIFSKENLLEVKLACVSKATAVEYDRSLYERSYAICVGDSRTDYDMLPQCDLGIYPNRLIASLRKKPFTSIGTDVSKIIVIEDEYFITNNLREAIAAFIKVDKILK